jgi:hypothetical protein
MYIDVNRFYFLLYLMDPNILFLINFTFAIVTAPGQRYDRII